MKCDACKSTNVNYLIKFLIYIWMYKEYKVNYTLLCNLCYDTETKLKSFDSNYVVIGKNKINTYIKSLILK